MRAEPESPRQDRSSPRMTSLRGPLPLRGKGAEPYRCCFVDGRGSVRAHETVECANEREAVELALRMWAHRPHHDGIELWQGARRLLWQMRPRSSGRAHRWSRPSIAVGRGERPRVPAGAV
jgi:hypothetical protein